MSHVREKKKPIHRVIKYLIGFFVFVMLNIAMLFNFGSDWSIVYAETGTIGSNIDWKLDEAGCLTISGSGVMPDYTSSTSTSPSPFGSYSSKIRSIKVSEGVTKIGNYTFTGCNALESVKLPSGLTTVGLYAFYGCSSLLEINTSALTSIREGAFQECSSLTSISLSPSLTMIMKDTFKDCTSLTEVNLGASVNSIGYSAFANCIKLDHILLPKTLKGIDDYAFNGCSSLSSIVIPSYVERVGNYAFKDCKRLARIEDYYVGDQAVSINTFINAGTEVEDKVAYICNKNVDATASLNKAGYTINLSKDVVYVGSSIKLFQFDTGEVIFYGQGDMYLTLNLSKDMKSVQISEGITNISDNTFSDCTNLTKVTIPSTVKAIGKQAFMNCTKLESIILPDGITTIGEQAFMNCSKLSITKLPQALQSIELETFKGCTSLSSVEMQPNIANIKAGAFQDCSQLANVKLPSNLVYIRENAFGGCTKLTEITIPAGITYIPAGTFQGCTSLTSVTMLTKLCDIGEKAFKDCISLKSFKIPSEKGYAIINTPYNIGNEAFMNCTSLVDIELYSGIKQIGINAFYNCSSLSNIFIPSSVETIRMNAFQNCSSLASITFDPYVTGIGTNVFLNCPKLETLKVVISGTKLVGQQSDFNASGNKVKLVMIDTKGNKLTEEKFIATYSAFRDYGDVSGQVEKDNLWYGAEIYTPYVFKMQVQGKDIRTLKYQMAGRPISLKDYTMTVNSTEGYIFGAWYTNDKYTGAYYRPSDTFVMPEADATLYAHMIKIQPVKEVKVSVAPLQSPEENKVRLTVEDYRQGETAYYRVYDKGDKPRAYNLGDKINTTDSSFHLVTSDNIEIENGHILQVIILGNTFDGYPLNDTTITKSGVSNVTEYRVQMTAADFKYNLTPVQYNGKEQALKVYAAKISSYEEAFTVYYDNGMTKSSQPPVDAGTYKVTVNVGDKNDYVRRYYIGDKIYLGEYKITGTQSDTPKELKATGVTAHGLTNGNISGTTTVMEYKLKGTDTYKQCSDTTTTGLAAGTYLVRVAASKNYEPSKDVEVKVEDSRIQLPPTNLSAEGITLFGAEDGIINGTSTAMEYMLKNSGATYKQCLATQTTGLAAGTYLVRYAAVENQLDASANVEVTVAPSKKQKAPVKDSLIPTGVKTFGAADGSIIGTSPEMEYMLKNSGAIYKQCLATQTTGLAAGTYLVRNAAKGNQLEVSEPVEVTVAPSKKQKAPNAGSLSGSGVSAFGVADGSIIGTTPEMEYMLKDGSAFTKCSEKEPKGLVAGTYLVRYAAKENELETSDSVEVIVDNSNNQSPPTGLSTTQESKTGAADGSIIGTTPAMEYRPEGGKDYIACLNGATTGLSAGTYLVRFADTKTGLGISKDVPVVITVVKSYFINGIIKDTQGEVVTDGTVYLHKSTGHKEVNHVQIGSDGHYSFTQVPNGSYTITVEKNNKTLQTINITVDGMDVSEGVCNIIIPAPTYSVAGTVSIVTGGAISGTAVSGSAVSGAAITLSTSKGPEMYSSVTDDNGNYIVHNVPNGSYTITVTKSDKVIATEKVNVKNSNVVDKNIVIEEKDPKPENPDPTPILKSQDVPTDLTSTRVSEPNAKDGKINNTTTAMEYKSSTSDDSKYLPCSKIETTDLAAGTYLVRYAAKEGYLASDTVSIVVEPAEIKQPPITATYSVSGTVKYANAEVISDAVITVTSKDNGKTSTATTNKNGFYTIQGLTDGHYTVKVELNNKVIATGSVKVNGSNLNNDITDVIVENPTPILMSQDTPKGLTSTRVSEPGAKDGTIKYTSITMEYKSSASDNSKYLPCGNNETTGLAAGTYLVRYAAWVGFRASDTVSIVVEEAETKQPPITATYSVSGIVKYANAGAISDAIITLTSKDSGKTSTTTTDKNGFYTIQGLTDGHYTVTVTVNNTVVASDSVKVKDSNVNIDITNIKVENPSPVTPEPTPVTPEPTPVTPNPTPATPEPTPVTPEPTPVTPNPTPVTPDPTPVVTPKPTPVVTPKPTPKIVKTEEIKRDVKVGDTDTSSVSIAVQRTTDSEGNKRDTATYSEESAKKTIQKLKEEGKNIARITLPDENKEIKETNVMIPTNSLETIAKGNIDLEISTERAKIAIPKETLQNASKEVNAADTVKKEDVYFNITPIEVEEQKEQVIERAKQENVVKAAVKDGVMTVVGTPMVIETNMPQSNVEITLPINTSDLPVDKAAREKFLSKLAVFIEHSDGEMELVRGEIVDYKENELGIKFNVKKFSTFTILQADTLELKSSECEVSKVTSPKGAIVDDNKVSLTVKNSTKKVKVNISVSEAATWKLYSDAACKKEIKNKYLTLKTGKNKAYIKVFAEDGTPKVYTVTVLRKEKVVTKK